MVRNLRKKVRLEAAARSFDIVAHSEGATGITGSDDPYNVLVSREVFQDGRSIRSKMQRELIERGSTLRLPVNMSCVASGRTLFR